MSNEDYQCPNCGHVIRATNIEYWYETREASLDTLDSQSESRFEIEEDRDDAGKVLPYPLELFEDEVGDSRDGEQLWYCPQPPEECRVMRLFPGDSE